MARERKEPRGLVIVNTGNGKGKTTAAIGLAVRAAGNGMRVLHHPVHQGALEDRRVSRSLPLLAPYFELDRIGHRLHARRLRDARIPMDEHEEARGAGLRARRRETVRSGEHDMVILDEILGRSRRASSRWTRCWG